MQKSFNSFKCLMISINLSSRQFLRGDSAELRELQEALASANQSWTQACGGLESWERRLHTALMTCQVRELGPRGHKQPAPVSSSQLSLLLQFYGLQTKKERK